MMASHKFFAFFIGVSLLLIFAYIGSSDGGHLATLLEENCAPKEATSMPFEIVFDEPSDRLGDIDWPVTLGVPFSETATSSLIDLTVLDHTNVPVPTQKKVLARWDNDQKTEKWVLLDFMKRFDNHNVLCSSVINQPTVSHPTPIQIEEDDSMILINTGEVSFSISKKRFSFFDMLRFENVNLLKDSSVYWIDENTGVRYETRNEEHASVVIEESGPIRVVVRAEGWYKDNEGNAVMKYQMRIAAFAGQPYVRIYHTLIWSEGEDRGMKEFGISLSPSLPFSETHIGHMDGNAAMFSLTEHQVSARQSSYNMQETFFGETQDNTRPFSGWMNATDSEGKGITLSVRDFAKQTPKELRSSSGSISVVLWSKDAGREALWMDPEHRVDWDSMTASDQASHREYYNIYKNRRSPKVAKTHEIWLWPTNTNTHSEVLNDYVQRPIVAVAAPVYQTSTNAIAHLRTVHSTDSPLFSIESGISKMFKHMATPFPELGDFEMWNYGDIHLFRQSNSRYRDWGGMGYNWPAVPWQMFYRSGSREYFEAAVRNARHVMDTDILQLPEGTLPAGTVFAYNALHWGDLWNQYSFVTQPEFLQYTYYLTGYERALDVLRLMRDAQPGKITENLSSSTLAMYDTPEEREFYLSRDFHGGMQKVLYYDTFKESAPIEGVQGNDLDWAVSYADWYLEQYERIGFIPNNTFYYFFTRPLESIWLRTGDERILQYFLSLTEPFISNRKTLSRSMPSFKGLMVPFFASFRATQNPEYLRYPLGLLNEIMNNIEQEGVPARDSGVGYSYTSRAFYPYEILNALELLGICSDSPQSCSPSWEDFRTLQRSHIILGETGSSLTFYAAKPLGLSGTVSIDFQTGNLASENLEELDVHWDSVSHAWMSDEPHNLVSQNSVRFTGVPTNERKIQALGSYYYIRVLTDTSFTLHQSLSESLSGAREQIPNFADSLGYRIFSFRTVSIDVTNPNGEVHTHHPKIPLKAHTALTSELIQLRPEDPAGVYTIRVRSNIVPYFVVQAFSDLPGFVTESRGCFGPGTAPPSQCVGAENYLYGPSRVSFTTTSSTNSFLVYAGFGPTRIVDHNDQIIRTIPKAERFVRVQNLPTNALYSFRSSGNFSYYIPESGYSIYSAMNDNQWFNPLYCSNGLDDDGDELIDTEDIDCDLAILRDTCGDGIQTGAEQCDDSNIANGDGCSSVCAPESGWECLSSQNCTDINECELESDDCSEFANCTNISGDYLCECKEGYVGNGKTCDKVAECMQDSDCSVGYACIEGQCITIASSSSSVASTPISSSSSSSVASAPISSSSSSSVASAPISSSSSSSVASAPISSSSSSSVASEARNSSDNSSSVSFVYSSTISTNYSSYTHSSTSINSEKDFCGNGVINDNELCDWGKANSNELPNTCRTNCRFWYCSDGVVDSNEECDDGNRNSDDICSKFCTLPCNSDNKNCTPSRKHSLEIGAIHSAADTTSFSVNDAADFLARIGILKGRDNNIQNLDLNSSVNRAEIAVLISRAFSYQDVPVDQKVLWDIPKSIWYEQATANLVSSYVIKGYADGSFRGERRVTLAEAVKMISIAANITESGLENTFGPWYSSYMSLAAQNGLLGDLNHIPADAMVNRGTISLLLFRALTQSHTQ